ncbi:hypothetical protein UFOVP450_188 [uncultured Caudovirales phage]|uniref:Uncharacterized protein n=1 Tax=uncultured Caudovirales phage TaxID=2100421 RepID=A0A6J5MBF9_9CAUD|nr:hypothetical protein UFOVP450_188 [uncultured Caudovirales phage]
MSVNVNTTTNTITIQQDATRVVQVATAGPQGAQGPSVIGGVAKYIPQWTSSQSLSTSSLYQVTTKQVILGATASVHPGNEEAFAVYQGVGTSYNLISGHSNIDSYSQLNIKNFSGEENASSDIVATRNDGNENTGYIDMGINSSGYTNTALVGAAGDAYLYATGENLYIGNATPSKQVVIFNGGLDATANARVYIHDQGTVSINTDEIGPDPTNPPALFVHPTAVGASNFNMIVAEADVNNYSQIALINKNAGAFASADIVAQNDIGTETDHYVDMGINSSTRAPDSSFTVGEANDTYLLSVSTGGSHYIGSPKNSDIYIFTGDNFNGKAHAKAVFKANNEHQISGSLNISGSITLNNLLTLQPLHPLPEAVRGTFAVSASDPPKPYFSDGNQWNALY